MTDQPIQTETVTSSPSPEQASPQLGGNGAATSAPVIKDERTALPIPPSPPDWASDDEVFKKLFPGETLPGKPVAQAPAVAPESPKAEAPEAQVQEPQQVQASSPEQDAAMEKALATLRRDEIPSSAIEKMSRDQVLAYGEKRAKIREGIESAYRELADLKKTKGQAPENRAEPTGQPSALNLAEALKPFAEIHEPETVKALEKTLQTVAEQIQSQMRTQYEQRVTGAETAARELATEIARERLTQTYGVPITDEVFGKVMDKAGRLANAGGYNSFREVLSDAARLVLGESKSNTASLNGKRDAGQPVASARAPVAGPKNREDAWFEAMQAMDRGMSKDEARRIAQAGF